MLDKFKISKNFNETTKEFKFIRESTLPPINFSTEKITRQSSVYLSASIRRETPNFSTEKEQDYLEDQFVKSEYDMIKIPSENNLINAVNNPAEYSNEIERVRSIPKKKSAITPKESYRLAYVVVDRIDKESIFVKMTKFLKS